MQDILNSFIDIGYSSFAVMGDVVTWLFEERATILGTYSPMEFFLGAGLISYLIYAFAKFLVPI